MMRISEMRLPAVRSWVNPMTLVKTQPHWLLMLPALVLLVGIFLIPVIALLGISVQESVPIRRYEAGFTFGSYQRFFTDPWYLNQWATTFKIMSIVTAIVVVLGYPLSYMIWRAKGRRKGILLAVVLLPLFTNIIARIYAWLVVLAKEGPINWVLTKTPFVDDPILLNFNFWTVILGVTYVAIPYFILILWSSLEGVDWNLVESARTMGAGKFRSILETVVPLSAAGFAGALAVTMTWGTGAYAEPTVLGSPKEWTTGIEAGHQILRAYDWPYGAALSFVLVSSTMLAIIVMYRLVVRKRWMV